MAARVGYRFDGPSRGCRHRLARPVDNTDPDCREVLAAASLLKARIEKQSSIQRGEQRVKVSVWLYKVVAATALLGASASHAAAPTVVHVGIANASSDVAFFIADKKGYFRDEGIDARFIPFDSGAKM